MRKSNRLIQSSKNLLLLGAAVMVLSACVSSEQLSRIGQAPPLSPIENPNERAGANAITMPMPAPERAERQANSLWQPGARAFFRDQRAARVGDILTVVVDFKQSAKFENETDRSMSSSNNLNVANILGLQGNLDRFLPEQFASTNPAFVDTDNASSFQGDGEIERKDEVNFNVAAIITQVLPNGNLVIHGTQEVLLNREKREIMVSGVIRPEDISSENAVNYDQIAEARILYGGKGTLSDVQYPRYGQELTDAIIPF